MIARGGSRVTGGCWGVGRLLVMVGGVGEPGEPSRADGVTFKRLTVTNVLFMFLLLRLVGVALIAFRRTLGCPFHLFRLATML
jgi:hypothetical protein